MNSISQVFLGLLPCEEAAVVLLNGAPLLDRTVEHRLQINHSLSELGLNCEVVITIKLRRQADGRGWFVFHHSDKAARKPGDRYRRKIDWGRLAHSPLSDRVQTLLSVIGNTTLRHLTGNSLLIVQMSLVVLSSTE